MSPRSNDRHMEIPEPPPPEKTLLERLDEAAALGRGIRPEAALCEEAAVEIRRLSSWKDVPEPKFMLGELVSVPHYRNTKGNIVECQVEGTPFLYYVNLQDGTFAWCSEAELRKTS